MIEINIVEKIGYAEIGVSGHAGYAEQGKDIVCASVSTIVELAILGLSSLAEQYPDYIKVNEKSEI